MSTWWGFDVSSIADGDVLIRGGCSCVVVVAGDVLVHGEVLVLLRGGLHRVRKPPEHSGIAGHCGPISFGGSGHGALACRNYERLRLVGSGEFVLLGLTD